MSVKLIAAEYDGSGLLLSFRGGSATTVGLVHKPAAALIRLPYNAKSPPNNVVKEVAGFRQYYSSAK